MSVPAMRGIFLPSVRGRASSCRPALGLSRPVSRFMASANEERTQDIYQYTSPPFYKTRREDLKDKWGNLGFAIRPMNGHVRFTWSDGSWDQGVFVPAPYQLMHINAGALHYGVAVFEGMKAFACKDGKIRLQNPELNAMRMAQGAKALLMPEVPKDLFVSGVKEAVRRNSEFVPPHGHNASMYIRPLLFASGPMLGLAPLASEYTFFVTVMPAGGYFASGVEEGVRALVSEDHDRAAPKGTGCVKAAGNYAADLAPVHHAHKAGFNTTLYLDAKERKYVEEFSVCNFVGITHDNRYVTPKSETILASTTNKMLMHLARDRGMIVEERAIDFAKEIGNFKEVGMCGTAAVVVKVASITQGETVHNFDTFDTISSLRAQLTGIQCGDVEDKFGWMAEVCDVFDEDLPALPVTVESSSTGMITAEATGTVRKVGPDSLHGHERHLLEHVVKHAEAGNPDSVLAAMDAFWTNATGKQASEVWNVRGQLIEEKLIQKANRCKREQGKAVRCLEMGTYCGYSALRIAKNLPEGATLLSVERDAMFAAIATKIIEFAGLDSKVKIWMGTVHSELAEISERLAGYPADFVLVDHSKERFVPDLKLLEESGIVNSHTLVVGDLEIYPGDDTLPKVVQQDIKEYFVDHDFVLSTIV